MIFRLLPVFAAATLALTGVATAADPAPATTPAAALQALPEGATVVLLGDVFFERDYNYGHIETALTSALGKGLHIRNLGWSGDTPRCESRSYFGPPAEGQDRLRKQLAEIKPAVVIACYGAVDAFKGEAGVKDFTASYGKLLDLIQKSCGASVVLMSPPTVSGDFQKWRALEGHAAKQALYRDAIRDLAAARSLPFADLLASMKDVKLTTVNGVSLTEADYRATALPLVQSLGLPADAAASAVQYNSALTKKIMEKNRLFFHRWRPQNETYLFGFRKHEQGNNGVEIPQFDPLILEKDKEIAALLKK